MTQFKFRLETLLKLREGHRDECRGRLEQAEEAEAILNEQSEALSEERKQIEARSTSMHWSISAATASCSKPNSANSPSNASWWKRKWSAAATISWRPTEK